MHLSNLIPLGLTLLSAISAKGSPAPAKRGGGKRGIAYPPSPSTVDADLSKLVNYEVTWIYDWTYTPVGSSSGFGDGPGTFVPMIWNGANIQQFVDYVIANGYKTILTFNEPDYADQANMTPENAAQLWIQYLEPLRSQHGVRLGAPAVTSAPSGRQWLSDFVTACNGQCHVDFLPLHYYGDSTDLWTNSWDFGQYIWSMHGEFPSLGNVWITEFASTSTNVADVETFLKECIAILDSYDWIERYAWFGAFRTSDAWGLLDTNGNLTPLGEIYVSS